MIPHLLAKVLLDGAAAELAAAAAVRGLDLVLTADVSADRLKALGPKARVAVLKGANRTARPVRAAVVATAAGHQRYGFLAKSIGTKTRLYKSGRG